MTIAVRYFNELFTASDEGDTSRIFTNVKRRATEEMNTQLLQEFSEDEIWREIKQMRPLKAPWVDGFPILFFQRYLYILGSKVTSFCLKVLLGDVAVEEISATHIVLTPKVSKPHMQFRLISICNVIYKIIIKVIVNRMSGFLDCCIHETQGAVISSRHISNNVLIPYEILHTLKNKKWGKGVILHSSLT